MTKRIRSLTDLTLEGAMFPRTRETQFDPEDAKLSETERDVKHICEFIAHQEPVLTKYSRLTGLFHFDDSVVGDAFTRLGHRNTKKMLREHMLKPFDNLCTLEWQHATADYKKVLAKGISGIMAEINDSLQKHTSTDKRAFLQGMRETGGALIDWAHKCADRAESFAQTVEEPEYKNNLDQLAGALRRVPEQAPRTFYEAVLTICVCFSADPDSLGTLDRYLTPFYRRDLKNGTLTRDEAKEYFQELFLLLQSYTSKDSDRFTRGGESHFCVGGYLPDGKDGFNEVSHLIVEALMELPTWIPQISLRWTKKTPHEVFRYMLDCERNDPNKRIAFQNDEARIGCFTKIDGIPYEKAVSYTSLGCNEIAFPGSIVGATSTGNAVHCIDTLFHRKAEEIADAEDFDAFYQIFEKELFSDLEKIMEFDDAFNAQRAKDQNYISSLFFNGCIERGKSLTDGGCDTVIAAPSLIGLTNVIDSLIVVKQFVYDEKFFSMRELTGALEADWEGFETMQTLILKKAEFFGNDTKTSRETAQRFYGSLYRFFQGRKNLFGYPIGFGDLTGYNPHQAWFGREMGATPDGRRAGEPLSFGIGQSDGKDRKGLTALLNDIAQKDKSPLSGGGPTVTNLMLDPQLVKNDANFDRTVDALETYFQNGGVHFQLTYLSSDDLLRAKAEPDKYRSLRVRVSGFSDYFVNLSEELQDNIIHRTVVAH